MFGYFFDIFYLTHNFIFQQFKSQQQRMAWYDNTNNDNKSSSYILNAYLTFNSITQFMDNETILVEINGKTNQDLIRNIIDNKKYTEELINFVTVMPQQNDSNERKHKYPLLACQILESLEQIFKRVFNDPDRKEIVISFLNYLNNPKNLNSILPSYFSRIFDNLCQPIYYNSFIKYLNKTTLHKLICLSQNACMVRCLKSLLIVDEKNTYQNIENWSDFQVGIIQNCFEVMQKTNEEFALENLLDLFIEMVQKNSLIYNKKKILQKILEQHKIDYFFMLVMKNQSYSLYAIRLIQEILNHVKKIQNIEPNSIFQKFLTNYQLNTKNFLNLLGKPDIKSLEIIEMVTCGLKLKRGGTFQFTLVKNGLLEKIFNLFFSNPNANIIHQKIQKLILTVIQQQCQEIIDYLFEDFDVIKKTAFFMFADKKHMNHFGHLIRIAKHYTTFKQETPKMSIAIARNRDTWKDFCTNTLQPYLRTLEKELGSYENAEQSNKQPTLFKIFSNISLKQQNQDTFKFSKVPDSKIVQEEIPSCPITLDIIKDSQELRDSNYIPSSKVDGNEIRIDFEMDKSSDMSEQKQRIEDFNQSSLTTSASSTPPLLELKQTSQTPPQLQNQIPPPLLQKCKNLAFEQFMNKRKGQIQTSLQKSKTPNKQPNILNSIKKRSKWDSAQKAKFPIKITSIEQPETTKNKQKGFLPKINLFKIHRKVMSKTGELKMRPICAERDSNLFTVLSWVKKQPLQIKNMI